jgi:hypothetical protein
MSAELDQIAGHLEFLGYAISADDEGRVVARHPSKPNLVVRDYRGGCLLTAYFTAGAAAGEDRAGYLDVINSLNSPATVARFYADDDDDLAAEAFYNLPYDRASFGRFMDLWDQDFDRARSSEIARYLA